MRSFEKIKEVLADVSITEEQKAALDEFFGEFYEMVYEKAREEAISEYSEELSEETISKDEAMNALKMQKEQFMETAESAFQNAIEDVKRDLAEEYSERLADSLDELYESVYERVKKDFMNSSEYATLESIKKAVTPLVVNEDNAHLVTEIEKLREELVSINEEKEELNRKEIVKELVSDIDDQQDRAVVLEFIEGAKDEEEIYERYNLAMAILEKRSNKVVNEDEQDDQDLESQYYEEGPGEEDEEDEDEDYDDEEESVFESESNDQVININKKRKVQLNDFEEKLMSTVFKKKAKG